MSSLNLKQRPDMDCYARRRRIYSMLAWSPPGINPSPPGVNAMSEPLNAA